MMNNRTSKGMNQKIWGDNNTVSGMNAQVVGNNNTVSGMNAKVYGNNNTVVGMNSKAYGKNNYVSGMNSRSFPVSKNVPICVEDSDSSDESSDDYDNYVPAGATRGFTSSGNICGNFSMSSGNITVENNKIYKNGVFVANQPPGSLSIMSGTVFVNNKQIYPVPQIQQVKEEKEAKFSMLSLEGNAVKGADDAKNNTLCVICLENLKNIMLTPCHHLVFCIECARTDQLDDNCPICRKKYTSACVVYT